ncbi:hypothetical protein [Streptomyces monashensis]|uniref:Aminoglycoside phosphotransferase domain-containing protein n=1 Tax=Streptomyces monashensis TaxID=1678012 RepID=A0A1S2PYY1_9ACTN|nr:hypothetical protein [Streptomyces monashensis]OIJ99047.1 hypothetical protein BIV23_28910 [Streptomyces monashensis]
MSAPATGRTQQEFGTGYLHTRISALSPGRYAWQRRPGPDRTVPLRQPTTAFRRQASAAAHGTVRFATPTSATGSDGALTYLVPGSMTAAGLLSCTLTAQQRDQLLRAMSDAGHALRALHRHAHPSTAPDPAPGPARLLAWLDTGTGPRAAAALHQRMTHHLGASRWDEARQWCRAAVEHPGAAAVTLHGAFGLGQIVMADSPDQGAVILAGEDTAGGQGEFDAGWLLGELAEFQMLSTVTNKPQPLLGEARDHFLAAYGPVVDGTAMARAAVLRTLTHVHDFAAFVGWHPELLLYAGHIADLIDDQGASTLHPW